MSDADIITLSDSDESASFTEIRSVQSKRKENPNDSNSENSDIDFPEVVLDNVATYANESPNELLFHEEPNLILSPKKTLLAPDDIGTKRNAPKKNKAKVSEERLRRDEELARNKALKAIAAKKLRDMKPGECLKFIEVTLDVGIMNLDLATDITTALQQANIRYKLSRQLILNSITWKREIEESYVDETNNVRTAKNMEEVETIIVIWNWEETVKKVVDQTVLSTISSIKDLIPKSNISLVIYGIQEYFACKSKERKPKKKRNSDMKNAPEISPRQLEMCLAEIQILNKCSSRLIDNPEELALMICQYSKSIAEIPFKKEQHKNWKDKFDWYVSGDNRDTVRVDKDGNGLRRLWEQQLQMFNASSLEVAQTISSLYPSPASLMEAFASCTENDGMNLLKDIPIRRAAGPLTAARKIGIELSKKIYLTFTSKDGDTALR